MQLQHCTGSLSSSYSRTKYTHQLYVDMEGWLGHHRCGVYSGVLYGGINSPVFWFAFCTPFSEEIKCPSLVQQSWFIFLHLNLYFPCQKSLLLHFSEFLTPGGSSFIIPSCLCSSKPAAAVVLPWALVRYESSEGCAVSAVARADTWCPYGPWNLTLRPFFTEFDPGPTSQTLAVRGLVSNGHLCFIIILNKHN